MLKNQLKNNIPLHFVVFLSTVFFLSCSVQNRLVYGDYYSQGEYIVECNNKDGWRDGHYLLTIYPSNTFELKEVSVGLGIRYTVCSGELQRQKGNVYVLNKIKVDYPYGVLGNPYYNDNNYRMTIKNDSTVILQKETWETVLQFIPRDSIPAEFDFKKYGYDMYRN